MGLIHKDKKEEPSKVFPTWLIPFEDIREKYSGIRLVEPKPIPVEQTKPKCTCHLSRGDLYAVSGSVVYLQTSSQCKELPARVYCKYPHYKMDYIK